MKKDQKLDLLLAIYISAIVAAELLGSKIFTINNIINASVAIFVFPLTFTINDIVAEVYGKPRAQSFMRSGFYVLLGLAAYTLLAITLPPASRFSSSNPAYQLIFAKSFRIIIASLAAFWLSERFDIYIYARVSVVFSNNNRGRMFGNE